MDATHHFNGYLYARNDAFFDDEDASFISPTRFSSSSSSSSTSRTRIGVVPPGQTSDYASTSATTSPSQVDPKNSENDDSMSYRRARRRPRTHRPVVLFERHVQQLELEARQREASLAFPRYQHHAYDLNQPVFNGQVDRRSSGLQLQPPKLSTFYAVQPYQPHDDYELERRQYYGQLRTNSISKQRREEFEVNWTFNSIFDQIAMGWTLLRLVLAIGFIVHVVQVLLAEAAEKERWGGRLYGS